MIMKQRLISQFENFEDTLLWNQLSNRYSAIFSTNILLKSDIYKVNFNTNHKYVFFFDLYSTVDDASVLFYPGFWNTNNSIYIREALGYRYGNGNHIVVRNGVSGNASFHGGNKTENCDNLAVTFQFINATAPFEVSNCFCVDLTILFGAGNEITNKKVLACIREYCITHKEFTLGTKKRKKDILNS